MDTTADAAHQTSHACVGLRRMLLPSTALLLLPSPVSIQREVRVNIVLEFTSFLSSITFFAAQLHFFKREFQILLRRGIVGLIPPKYLRAHLMWQTWHLIAAGHLLYLVSDRLD